MDDVLQVWRLVHPLRLNVKHPFPSLAYPPIFLPPFPICFGDLCTVYAGESLGSDSGTTTSILASLPRRQGSHASSPGEAVNFDFRDYSPGSLGRQIKALQVSSLSQVARFGSHRAR